MQQEEIIESQTVVKPKFLPRFLKFFGLFVAALPIVAFFPLFIERTMIRSQTSGGDVIDYEWKIRTFYGFLSSYSYFRPEEYFAVSLAVNLILVFIYASIVAFVIVLFSKKLLNFRAKAKARKPKTIS